MTFLLLLAAITPEPGDWAARRGAAALALDKQPGNDLLWSEFCIASWMGGEQRPCVEGAPHELRRIAKALIGRQRPEGEHPWALRAQIAFDYQARDLPSVRQVAQRLYELEPDNSWALEAAMTAAYEDADHAMALALARRGAERFGGDFVARAQASKRLLHRRGKQANWLFLAGVGVLVFVSFRQGRRQIRRQFRRRRRRSAASRR